jgi:flavin reductase (DIM6/NTAB) family NADH-FMN oxidoreductase RutF
VIDLAADTRTALRRMAKSVCVISCAHDGRRYAMAATATDVVSLDPPSMVVSVNRAASLHAALSAGADFCVNVLGRGQEDVARACGGGLTGEERFTVGAWREGAHGLPILDGAQANILCRNEVSTSFGTHGLFVGVVIEARVDGAIDPLVYLDGRYTGTLAG